MRCKLEDVSYKIVIYNIIMYMNFKKINKHISNLIIPFFFY